MREPLMMHVGGRAAGKTHRLMKWVESLSPEEITNLAILVHNNNEASRLRDAWIEKHGPEAPQPRWMDYASGRSGQVNGRNTRFAIDNLDLFLSHMYGYPVVYATMTGEITEP